MRRPWCTRLIVALNVLVYLAWQVRDWLGFMEQHFLVSWSALLEGRVYTLLTSVFSHENFLHLLVNMLVLLSFGSVLEQVLGWRRYLTFYLLAGIAASATHALVSAFLLGQPEIPALGASGAIAGLVVVFAFVFPKERILIFGIIPVPALWGAGGAVLFDFWGLWAQAGGGGLPIGHGAHLGGAAAGLAYYWLYLRRFRRRV